MATLTPPDFVYVADHGNVTFSVLSEPFGDAVLFERAVPFTATTAPPYSRVSGVFTADQAVTHRFTAPMGSLYQARLYRRGDIAAGQVPDDADAKFRPIGRLDIPCIGVEGPRSNLLTRCAGDRAPIRLEVGGNYLKVSLATGSGDSRLLVLVGGLKPGEIQTGQGPVPAFVDNAPLTFASSAQRSRLHRVFAPPQDHFPYTDRLVPRQDIWFIAIAWQADGTWDYVWSDQGISPEADPQMLTTKTRQISVDVQQLTCVDDSAYDGDTDPVKFTLALQDSGSSKQLASDTYDWDDMEAGDVVRPRLSLDWSGGDESEGAVISIGAADNWAGTEQVPLPIGDGSLHTTHSLRIRQYALSPPAGFYADVTATVSYTD